MEITNRIIELMETLDEGLNHIKRQLSELRYEEALMLFADAITIDKTHASWDGTDDAGIITLTKNADGTLKVEIDTSGGTAVTDALVSTDELEADADGNFKYNAHGISFEISKEDYAAMTGTTPMEITVTDAEVAAETKSTASDFTTNTVPTPGTNPVATVEGFTVTKTAGWENIKDVTVEHGGTGGNLTVTITKADGTVSTDVITADDVSYDNHGVKFDFKLNDATAVEFTKTFETEMIEKEAVTGDNKSLKFQVGANQDQSISLSIEDMGSKALKVDAIKVDSHDAAKAAITTVNEAIEKVSGERSKLGAIQNRLEHTIKNLDTSSENLQASESRIRDVDMAKEMMEQTKQNILAQASTAMLAQANQAPQAVLQLLR